MKVNLVRLTLSGLLLGTWVSMLIRPRGESLTDFIIVFCFWVLMLGLAFENKPKEEK